MSPKSIFQIIIKILGIFFIKDIIDGVPQLVASVIFIFQTQSEDFSWTSLFITLFTFGIYTLIPFILVFRTDKVVNILKLDRGFNQETLTLDVPRSTIFTIGVVVTGALVLTNEIPNFCRYLLAYIQERNMPFRKEVPDYSRIVFSGIKILIGLLLIGERKRIVAFVDRKEDEQVQPTN